MIFNDHSNTYVLDNISVPTQNNRKRPLKDDRIIRTFFEVNRDEMGKQILDSDGRIKCTMCGKRYFERGIQVHFVSCLKNEQ